MMRSLLLAGLATFVMVVGVTLALWWGATTVGVPAAADPALAVVSPAVAESVPTSAAGGPAAPARPLQIRPEVVPPDGPVSNPPRRPETPATHPRDAARLAIVVDDLGHNVEAPRRLLALGLPFTFSILPGRPRSREVMELVRAAGHEYLVHLPMEPRDYPHADPGADALMLAMDERATRETLAAHLASLPGAVGANNHMGSAYTADPAKMRIVQREVAARGMLFLNSRTIASPVPGRIAEQGGHRYLERDVFLDHDRSVSAIRAQLVRVAAQARRRGRAIAIAHPYPETLRVLREELPALLRDGVVMVPVSQL